MNKKDYINNIIQTCDKVLEYEELLNDLGECCEKVFYNFYGTDDIIISESLNVLASNLNDLKDILKNKCISEWANDIVYDLIDVSNFISLLLQEPYVEDVIADSENYTFITICSIMGKIRLLRNILKWINNEG